MSSNRQELRTTQRRPVSTYHGYIPLAHLPIMHTVRAKLVFATTKINESSLHLLSWPSVTSPALPPSSYIPATSGN